MQNNTAIKIKTLPEKISININAPALMTPKKLLINGHEIILTRRESDCLHCLAQGKTAKETARILGISNRTVEAYLENIKMKANIRHKSGLISIVC